MMMKVTYFLLTQLTTPERNPSQAGSQPGRDRKQGGVARRNYQRTSVHADWAPATAMHIFGPAGRRSYRCPWARRVVPAQHIHMLRFELEPPTGIVPAVPWSLVIVKGGGDAEEVMISSEPRCSSTQPCSLPSTSCCARSSLGATLEPTDALAAGMSAQMALEGEDGRDGP